jgi:hypothetical protein
MEGGKEGRKEKEIGGKKRVLKQLILKFFSK